MAANFVQMNTRIEADMKRRGDKVLEKYGLTPSQAVRSLWRNLGKTKKLPDFMVEATGEASTAAECAEAGAGMAVRLAAEAGLHCESLRDLSYADMRAAALEEWLLERGDGHA